MNISMRDLTLARDRMMANATKKDFFPDHRIMCDRCYRKFKSKVLPTPIADASVDKLKHYLIEPCCAVCGDQSDNNTYFLVLVNVLDKEISERRNGYER